MWGGYDGYDYGKGAHYDMGYNQGFIHPAWDKGYSKGYGKGEGYGKGAIVPMKGAGKGGKAKSDGKGGKGMWVMMPAGHELVRNAPKGKGGKNGGKGGGQQGGASKKRKKENTGPVQSIDESMVEQITDLLNENGGEIALGRMTTVFPGLKKAQIAEHFNVQESADGDYIVTNGIGSGILASGEKREKVKKENGEKREKVKKEKKAKKEKDPDAPPPPDLEQDVLNEITAHLEACGGCCVLGKLSTKFSGLKKTQLEAHFDVEHGEKDTIVHLLGHTGDPDAIEQGPAKKRQKDRQKGSNDAPPGDLDDTKVQEITDYLNAEGGSSSLGKVSTVFPGVKKKQLETNFVLSGGSANSDPIVSLS